MKDPVCGMQVDPAKAAGTSQYKGQTYHFCSQGCLDTFRASPETYLSPKKAEPHTHADTREYTCPMDPEVRQIGPGACPKCGMALEPVSAAPLTKTEWTCPMHPEIVRDEPGSCPICGMALEPRVVTLDEQNPESDVGIAGVFSFVVTERTREVGIHLALGATRRRVRTLLLCGSGGPIVIGVAIGLALAVVAGLALRSFLFGLRPSDPATFAGVVLVVTATAWAATLLPMRRALRIDPAITLRHD